MPPETLTVWIVKFGGSRYSVKPIPTAELRRHCGLNSLTVYEDEAIAQAVCASENQQFQQRKQLAEAA